jgi:hypothetical protein
MMTYVYLWLGASAIALTACVDRCFALRRIARAEDYARITALLPPERDDLQDPGYLIALDWAQHRRWMASFGLTAAVHHACDEVAVQTPGYKPTRAADGPDTVEFRRIVDVEFPVRPAFVEAMA